MHSKLDKYYQLMAPNNLNLFPAFLEKAKLKSQVHFLTFLNICMHMRSPGGGTIFSEKSFMFTHILLTYPAGDPTRVLVHLCCDLTHHKKSHVDISISGQTAKIIKGSYFGVEIVAQVRLPAVTLASIWLQILHT